MGVEMFYLRLSPVYWGFGVPEGDGSAVIVVPAFMGTDFYLAEFRGWLRRIGYRPYRSGIGLNAECPNLLISLHLRPAIEKAYQATGKKVHLVGHSLGGMIARAAAAQVPSRVASVITMAAPLNGLSVHSSVQRVVEIVRSRILQRHSPAIQGECRVLPDCYSMSCTCEALKSLVLKVPKSVRETVIYTKADGLVDWRMCLTGDPNVDVEVSATHIGMAFNPIVYGCIGRRLAEAQTREVRSGTRKRSRSRRRSAA